MSESSSSSPELTIYFDGSCPLCRREIALYRRLRGAERLRWLDVRADAPLGADLSCEAAMRRFHVRDAHGQLFSGGAAFARLWRALPGWRVAGWCMTWPPMSWGLELAYRAFLPLRPLLQRVVRRCWPDKGGFGVRAPCMALASMLLWSAAAQAQIGQRMVLDDLAGLQIDRTEVTIGQFARYVRATGVRTRAEQEGGGFEYVGGWQRRPGWTWRQPDGGLAVPELPAVHLTHAEAVAYCHWAGGRLPTAAEWRQAGFTELRAAPPVPWVRGKTYPWTTGDGTQGANTSGSDPWPRAAPVTQTRAGVNGLHDMGGNVWEWAADARGHERQTLGGSWWYPAAQMKADVQAWKPADFHAVYIGFRCVYEPGAAR